MLATTSTPRAFKNSTVSLNQDQHLHHGAGTAAVDHDKARSPGFSSSIFAQGLGDGGDGILGGHHGYAHTSALAVLAGTDLHQVCFAQVAERHPVLGMRGIGGFDGDGGHIVRIALGDLGDLI